MAAGAVTLAALVALELSKRETSGRFFHDALQFGKFAPGLLAVVLGLAAISTTCSYFGAERAVKALTPPPALVDADTLTAPIRGSLATIDGQIADAKKNTWQGKVTARAQRTIDRLTRQREALTNEMIRQQTRADTRNDATETAHTATTEANASGFAAFTLCCEVLLILSLWYLQYYDYRSFAEYCAKPEGKPADTAGLPLPKPAEQTGQISTAGSLAAELLSSPPNGSGKHTSNGTSNEAPRRLIGYAYANRNAHARTENVITQNVGSNRRTCEHCGIEYTYGHARQKYCCDGCRVAAWENRTGRTLKKPKPT